MIAVWPTSGTNNRLVVKRSGTRDKVNKSGTVPEIPGQLEPMQSCFMFRGLLTSLFYAAKSVVVAVSDKLSGRLQGSGGAISGIGVGSCSFSLSFYSSTDWLLRARMWSICFFHVEPSFNWTR